MTAVFENFVKILKILTEKVIIFYALLPQKQRSSFFKICEKYM